MLAPEVKVILDAADKLDATDLWYVIGKPKEALKLAKAAAKKN